MIRLDSGADSIVWMEETSDKNEKLRMDCYIGLSLFHFIMKDKSSENILRASFLSQEPIRKFAAMQHGLSATCGEE